MSTTSFGENGYEIIDGFLSANDLKEVFDQIDSILSQQVPKELIKMSIDDKWLWLKAHKPVLKSHAYDLFGKLSSVMKIVTNKNLINLIQHIFGTPLLLDKIQIRIDDSSNDRVLPMHQERGQISKREITIWIPLRDITEESGGVQIVPGSHRNGDLGVHVYDNKMGYTGVPPECLLGKPIKKVFMKAGDCLYFHWDLIHGSFQNRSDKIRYCIVARFNSVENIPYIIDETAPMNIPKN